MSSLYDDWDGLLKHPGWLRLTAWAKQHWLDEIAAHLAGATNDTDDLRALNKMRQVLAAQRAVEQLLSYPKEQLARVEHAGPMETAGDQVAQNRTWGRRGSL